MFSGNAVAENFLKVQVIEKVTCILPPNLLPVFVSKNTFFVFAPLLCVSLSAGETKITKCQSGESKSCTAKVRSKYGAGTEQVPT